jgi:hypothetical protein
MKNVILLLVILFLVGCGSTLPEAGINNVYKHMGANVVSPNELGWYLIGRTDYGVVFGKKYSDSIESAIANTYVYRVGKFESDEAFFEVLKQGRSEVKNKARFKQLEAEHALSSLNGRSCLKYSGISEDHGNNRINSSDFKYFKNVGYICRAQIDPTLALLMEVSHRSDSKNIPIEIKDIATQFFNNIEFTE